MSVGAASGAATLSLLSTGLGGLAALRWSRRIPPLMALAAGVVLAAAFCDLLPEAVTRARATGLSDRWPLGLVLVGFLFFHVLEQVVHRDAHHHLPEHTGHADEQPPTDHPDPGRHPDPVGLVGATGFVVHSFCDGLAIGLGFQVGTALGLLTAVAVIAHDFSDGLNVVTYLLAHDQPEGRSRRWLLADAVAPLAGALVASLADVPHRILPLALGFFCGLFVYTASTRLLPRAAEVDVRRSVPLTLAGAAAMFLVSHWA